MAPLPADSPSSPRAPPDTSAAAAASDAPPDDRELARRFRRRMRRAARANAVAWWSTKLRALVWVVAAVVAVFVSRLPAVLSGEDLPPNTPDLVRRGWLWLGVVLLAGVVASTVYMAATIPKERVAVAAPGTSTASATAEIARQAEADWERHPRIIPLTLVAALLTFVSLNAALWPIYRGFTPILLSLLWWGSLMALHFVPFC